MTTSYEGDPKIIITEEGADLVFKSGQPVMDRGLENAAMISIFTKQGWWGNTLMKKPAQKIGSDVEELAAKSVTLDNINNVRTALDLSLEWMKETQVASEIETRVSNPTANRLSAVALIKPPERDPELILLTRNGENWIQQKLDPAYLRV